MPAKYVKSTLQSQVNWQDIKEFTLEKNLMPALYVQSHFCSQVHFPDMYK